MMIYNPNYVYFEPVKCMLDKWCIAADSVRDIRSVLAIDNESIKKRLVQIKETNDNCSYPFMTTSNESDEACPFKFVYIDPAFQSMTREIYIGIDSGFGRLTYSINSDKFKHVYYKTSSIEDAKEWITERRRFEAVMGAWEDGAVIQKRESISDAWDDVVTTPRWDFNADYRVKPDEKVLEWTDLKIGDVITYIPNRDRYMLVTRIDKSADTSEHIFAGSWLSNDDLANWEKVED